MGSKRKQKESKRKQKQQRRATRAPAPELTAEEAYPEGGPEQLEARLERQASARVALSRDPQDVPALLLLAAEVSSGPAEQLALLRRARSSAEARLRASQGPDALERLAGSMRLEGASHELLQARGALLDALLGEGRAAEALEEAEALLRLAPADELLARVKGAAAAFELGLLDRAEACLRHEAAREFGAAPWERALLAFARGGPEDAQALALLSEACAGAPQVVALLLGWTGAAEVAQADARVYARWAGRAWACVPGALAWLYLQSERTEARVPARVFPSKLRTRVRALPLVDEAWRLDQRLLPETILLRDQAAWGAVVLAEGGQALASDLVTREPQAAALWSLCLQAMRTPSAGPPRRPRALELRLERYPELAGACLEAGIEARQAPEPCPELARYYAQTITALDGDSRLPSWTDAPGVAEGQVEALCAAAWDFFQHTPWQVATGSRAFRIEAEPDCSLFGSERPCAVILGAEGETFGLSLYESLEGALEAQAWTPEGSPPPAAVALNFDPAELLAPADRERIRAAGYPVAGEEAYPFAYRLDPQEQRVLAPRAQDLRRLEAALRLFPEALSAQERPDAVFEVTQGEGPALRLRVEEVRLQTD